MAMAEELSGNQRYEEDHVTEPPEATTTDVTSHGLGVYELHTLDMVEPEPPKKRSKLRLLAILIALDVSFSQNMFTS